VAKLSQVTFWRRNLTGSPDLNECFMICLGRIANGLAAQRIQPRPENGAIPNPSTVSSATWSNSSKTMTLPTVPVLKAGALFSVKRGVEQIYGMINPTLWTGRGSV